MVMIFSQTTAKLTREFTDQFSTEKLFLHLFQISNETGVEFKKRDSTFSIVGQWKSVSLAYDKLGIILQTLSQEDRLPTADPSNNSETAGRDKSRFKHHMGSDIDRTHNEPPLKKTDDQDKESDVLQKHDQENLKGNVIGPVVGDGCRTEKYKHVENSVVQSPSFEEASTESIQSPSFEEAHNESVKIEKPDEYFQSIFQESVMDHTAIKLTESKRGRCGSSGKERASFEKTHLSSSEVQTKDSSDERMYHWSSDRSNILTGGIKMEEESYTADTDTEGQDPQIVGIARDFSTEYDDTDSILKTESKAKSDENKMGKSASKNAETGPFSCELCPYVGAKSKYLKRHMEGHGNVEKVLCGLCKRQVSKRCFRKHVKAVHQRPNYFCEICQSFSLSKELYDIHVKSHESGYTTPIFYCKGCGKTFTTDFEMKSHIKTEHRGMEKTYVCPKCGKTYKKKSEYVIHAASHTGTKPYVCKICGLSFAHRTSLKAHNYIHEERKNFQCHICAKSFQREQLLNIHMKTHTGEKPFICTTCGKGFTTKNSLLRHERIHSGSKPFSCSVCQKTFNDESIIRRHLMLVHKKDAKNWGDFYVKTPEAVPPGTHKNKIALDALEKMGLKLQLDNDTEGPDVTSLENHIESQTLNSS